MKIRSSITLFSISFLFSFVFLFLGLVLPSQSQANDRYPFENPVQAKLFHKVTHELRCVVCLNQSIAESESQMASTLRQVLYEKIKQGESESQIMGFMAQEYGEFILLKPPVKWETSLLWGSPFILLLMGICLLWRQIKFT